MQFIHALKNGEKRKIMESGHSLNQVSFFIRFKAKLLVRYHYAGIEAVMV